MPAIDSIVGAEDDGGGGSPNLVEIVGLVEK